MDSSRANAAPPVVHEVLHSPAHPLDTATLALMESHFGHDFSQVRVHTNAKAAESARVVGALAYTVGRDVVFAAGQYVPGAADSNQLLAHELTHVIQQTHSSSRNQSSQDGFEAEADRNASSLGNHKPIAVSAACPNATLMRRQPAGTSSAQTTPNDVIDRARSGAFIRCQRAYERLAAIGPPPPPGRLDPAQMWQMRARTLARKIFNQDLNMDQVTDIVGRMRSLMTPGLSVLRAQTKDPECGNRAGYVRDLRPPIMLCQKFFASPAEEQIRTMTHEAAHLAGIGEAGVGESYCAYYDCETSCGGFDVADSWAHFVNCLSDQPPDVPPAITGRQP